MKLFKRVTVTGLGLAACALALTSDDGVREAEAATGYTMFCRGGGTLELDLSRTPAMRGPDPLSVRASYRFDKSKTKYGPSSLEPGECAWTDRPINASEPAILHYYNQTTSMHSSVKITVPPKGRPSFDVLNRGKSSLHKRSWGVYPALMDPQRIVEIQATRRGKQFHVQKVRMIHRAR